MSLGVVIGLMWIAANVLRKRGIAGTRPVAAAAARARGRARRAQAARSERVDRSRARRRPFDRRRRHRSPGDESRRGRVRRHRVVRRQHLDGVFGGDEPRFGMEDDARADAESHRSSLSITEPGRVCVPKRSKGPKGPGQSGRPRAASRARLAAARPRRHRAPDRRARVRLAQRVADRGRRRPRARRSPRPAVTTPSVPTPPDREPRRRRPAATRRSTSTSARLDGSGNKKPDAEHRHHPVAHRARGRARAARHVDELHAHRDRAVADAQRARPAVDPARTRS